MRFLRFDLGKPTPDENTIRLFREPLTQAGAIRDLFDAFERQLRGAGYLPMSGQIIDATLVSAPKQRNTDEEKAAIKAGKSAKEIWPDKPMRAAQKDTRAPFVVCKQTTVGQGVDGEAGQGQAGDAGCCRADHDRHSGVRLQESRLGKSELSG